VTKLNTIPVEWDAAAEGGVLEPGSVTYVRFLGQKLFDDYEPLQFQGFDTQLLSWLNNLDDEQDQKTLLALLTDLFFVGRREYASLYRSVYNGAMSSWIIDVCDLDPFASNIDALIRTEINKSWICPITDSLRINAFLKTNNLISQSVRPDWLSLKQFAEIEKVIAYCNSFEISNIILIEDFVGSGTQADKIVTFVGENFKDMNVLFAPLIVCPSGDEKLASRVKRYGNIKYDPQLVLPSAVIFKREPSIDDGPHHAAARELFDRIAPRFELPQFEDMYGFKSTGSQVALYSNCPNNTLPVFHHESSNWSPLFPRVRRVQ